VVEDRPLETLERLSGLEAKLFSEEAATCLVAVQGRGLAAGPIEREHELDAQALTQRMPPYEIVELADDVRVTAEGEIGLEPFFRCRQPELLQPHLLAVSEVGAVEICQRRPAPKGKPFPELLGRALGISGGERRSARANEPLEAEEVELVRIDVDHVAGRPRDEQRTAFGASGRFEDLAQLRDMDLQGGRRGLRRPIAPEPLDETVARDDFVRVQEKHAQQRALLRAAEPKRPAVGFGLEGPKYAELHGFLRTEGNAFSAPLGVQAIAL